MNLKQLKLKATNEAGSQEQFYKMLTERNLGILTQEQQNTISKARIAQAGVGGNSDIVLTMAQLGFQHFTLADPDVFEVSNFNRQMGADLTSLGKKKVHHMRNLLHAMNPWTEVQVLPEGVTENNINFFLKDVQVVVEAMDIQAAPLKSKLTDDALSRGIPVFTSPSPGWGAALLFFDPTRSPSMSELLGDPPSGEFSKNIHDDQELKWVHYLARLIYLSTPLNNGIPEGVMPELYTSRDAPSCISLACRLRASLIPTAVLKWLFHKEKLPCIPSVIHYDLYSNTIIVIKRTLEEFKRGLEEAEQRIVSHWQASAHRERSL
jgi:molybdopterin/thiamine biosynthesis adenylyltransferase